MGYRLFTGIRPTGQVHLGHFCSILRSWLILQARFDCYLCVADLHSLNAPTPDNDYRTTDIIKCCLVLELDLTKITVFLQSKIPEHSELCAILSSYVPVSWLVKALPFKTSKVGLLGQLSYPVLMLADMLLYNSHFVSVGKDQIPHLEITRLLVRKFRSTLEVPAKRRITEPTFLLSAVNCLAGPDGLKMSKSNSNTISLHETTTGLHHKVQLTVGDSHKRRQYNSGNPSCCAVWFGHKALSSDTLQADVPKNCQAGTLDCTTCKKHLENNLLRNQPSFVPLKSIDWCWETLEAIADSHCCRARAKAVRSIRNIRSYLRFSYGN